MGAAHATQTICCGFERFCCCWSSTMDILEGTRFCKVGLAFSVNSGLRSQERTNDHDQQGKATRLSTFWQQFFVWTRRSAARSWRRKYQIAYSVQEIHERTNLAQKTLRITERTLMDGATTHLSLGNSGAWSKFCALCAHTGRLVLSTARHQRYYDTTKSALWRPVVYTLHTPFKGPLRWNSCPHSDGAAAYTHKRRDLAVGWISPWRTKGLQKD